MHLYYVFRFTHLCVSVPLVHLQGAFCYRMYVIMCISNIQAFIIVWSEDGISHLLKCLCVLFGVQVETPPEHRTAHTLIHKAYQTF
jgi:hypothetical protein